MVFIKFLKRLDNQGILPYFITVSVINDEIYFIENSRISVVQLGKFIDYFWQYRKTYDGTYSIENALPSDGVFETKSTQYTNILVQQIEIEVQTMQESQTSFSILRNGQQSEMKIQRLAPESRLSLRTVIIIQQTQQISFVLRRNLVELFKITTPQIIRSLYVQGKQLYIINDDNTLQIIQFKLGSLNSSYQIAKCMDICKFGITQFCGNKIFSAQKVLQMSHFNLYELHDHNSLFDNSLDDLSDEEEQYLFISQQKVWDQEHTNEIYIQRLNGVVLLDEKTNLVFRMFTDARVTALTVSKSKYIQTIYDKNPIGQEFVNESASYSLIAIATSKDRTFEIKLFQQFKNYQEDGHYLYPIIEICDLKDQIQSMEFISPYDILFKDNYGRCGIIQFNIKYLGFAIK